MGLITDDWVPSVSVGSLELGKKAVGSAWSVGRGGSRTEIPISPRAERSAT